MLPSGKGNPSIPTATTAKEFRFLFRQSRRTTKAVSVVPPASREASAAIRLQKFVVAENAFLIAGPFRVIAAQSIRTL